MGYQEFTTRETLTISQSKGIQRKAKIIGMNQFIKLYELNKDHKTEKEAQLQHGFELEAFILNKDKETQSYFLDPETDYIYNTPYNTELLEVKSEGMASQIEITPRNPYRTFLCGKAMFENFFYITSEIPKFLKNEQDILFEAHFQGFGAPEYLKYYGMEGMNLEEIREKNKYSRSRTSPDCLITNHPRYLTGMVSYNERSGKVVQTHLETFKDSNTEISEKTDEVNTKPGYITHEGATASFSVSSLQVTFSSKDLSQARWQYDQLHILGSILVTLLILTYFLASLFRRNSNIKIKTFEHGY